MSGINHMDNPVCPVSLEEATLADIEVLECPYPTYKTRSICNVAVPDRIPANPCSQTLLGNKVATNR